MACCDESDDSDAVQPASRAQASVRRPGLRSGKSAAEPGEVDKLSGIRIEYRHTHKDAIRTLHSGGYIYRGVETLLDGPSSSSTGSDSGGDPQWFTTAVLVHKMDPKVTRNKDPYGRWELSNLRGGCKPVSLFLFGEAYHNNYNALVGEVFVIIDAKRKRLAPKGKAGGECSFSYYLDEQDKVLRIGSASEYDCCPVSGCHRHSVLEGSNPRGWCHAHSSSKSEPKGKGMQRQRVPKHAGPTGDIAVAAASGKPARVSRRAASGKHAPASGEPARVNRRAAASGKAAAPVSRQRRASSRAPAAPANEAQADELPYVHFDPGDRFPGDNRGDMNFGSYVAFYAKQHGVQIFAENKAESCEIRKEAAAG